jgi:hypothetical protein
VLVGLGVAVGVGVPPVMVIGEDDPGTCELGGSDDAGGSEDAGGGDTNGGMPSLSTILTSVPA